MSLERLQLPEGYQPKLDIMETEIAIKLLKDTFERELANQLNLTRVSAPFFVLPGSGLNDDLNGVERPVQFDVKDMGEDVQIVHSLAKWKRQALKRYHFPLDSGLYCDMNAIRRDEELDNIHSIYVDQWDWERVINREERNVEFLKETVRKIVAALRLTEEKLIAAYPAYTPKVAEDVTFITSQELEDRYPGFTPKQREDAICKECGTVFLMQIGGKLKGGKPHDGRAPDYDDWKLNGDLLVWYPILGHAFELSSMGIRVDEKAMEEQLRLAGCESRRELPFHKQLLAGELPLTMGGGIGQSRLCMYLLEKAHIGEVQAAVWPENMIRRCDENGIHLL